MRTFHVVVHHDPDGLWGEIPALDGCYSHGDTIEDLMANLREAAEGVLAEIESRGETIQPADVEVLQLTV